MPTGVDTVISQRFTSKFNHIGLMSDRYAVANLPVIVPEMNEMK